MSWISDFFNKTPSPRPEKPKGNKDPDDFTLCSLSTPWQIDEHYCSRCKCSTGHQEYLSGACNQCGAFGTQELCNRSWRKIWYEGKWQFQVRYQGRQVFPSISKTGGCVEIIEKWYDIKKDDVNKTTEESKNYKCVECRATSSNSVYFQIDIDAGKTDYMTCNQCKILAFIGKEVTYEKEGQYICGNYEGGGFQMLLQLRGWGAIQNRFKQKDESIDLKAAAKFQDKLGEWIIEAINEKLEKERK